MEGERVRLDSGTEKGGSSGAAEERMPVVALAGAPNVGKSTVFNALTGLRQHTGNWPGKTVVRAEGIVGRGSREYLLVDTPGTYSLLACSSDEEAARDFICFGDADAVIVVCSATNLERDLNLALQVMETTGNVVVCVNLMDEARRKGIRIDCPLLEKRLGVPVVPASAAKGEGLDVLADTVQRMAWSGERRPPPPAALWGARGTVAGAFGNVGRASSVARFVAPLGSRQAAGRGRRNAAASGAVRGNRFERGEGGAGDSP